MDYNGLHFHHMSLQSICPALDYGWKFILVIFVWLSFCVCFGMLCQKVYLWWCIITLVAFIWHFSIVYFQMFCNIAFLCESFAALVALERLLPRVRPHVALQSTRRSASVIALVTLEWLFPCVFPHHVPFQNTSCNAGKLALCASVRLFPRVGVEYRHWTIEEACLIIWYLQKIFDSEVHQNGSCGRKWFHLGNQMSGPLPDVGRPRLGLQLLPQDWLNFLLLPWCKGQGSCLGNPRQDQEEAKPLYSQEKCQAQGGFLEKEANPCTCVSRRMCWAWGGTATAGRRRFQLWHLWKHIQIW